MNRASRVAWPALTIVVASLAAVVAVAVPVGGPTGLLVGRTIARVVLDLAAAGVLGLLTTVLLLVPAGSPHRGRMLDAAGVAAGIWTVAAAVTTFLLYLGAAPSPSSPSFGPGLVSFVFEIAVGRTWLAATIAAAVLTALLVAIRSRTGVVALLAAATVALVPVALQSPAAGDPLAVERTLAAAELVRLVAVGVWLGAVGARLVIGDGPLRRLRAVGLGGSAAALAATGIAVGEQLQNGVPVAVPVLQAVVLVLGGLVALGLPSGAAGLLLGVEVVLLAVGAGLGVASTTVTTQVDTPARTTPAEILTGSPLPTPPTAAALLGGWRPDAIWLVVAGALLVGYLVAVRRRPPAGRWPVGRTASWTAGVLLLAWATSGGVAGYREVLLSAHLAQHVVLVLVVPLLLAGGGPLLLLRTSTPWVTRLARPVPAALLAAVAFAALYGTGLLTWSVADPVGAEWSVLQCLLTGGWLVAALLHSPARRAALVATAVALLVAESAGAAVLLLGRGLVLADWFGAMGWGTDALIDQRLAALICWPVAVVPTLVLLVAVVRRPRPVTAVVDAAPPHVHQEVIA